MTLFTQKIKLPQRIDVSALLPKTIAGLSVAQIEKLPLRIATQGIVVGDAFSVAAGNQGQVIFRTSDDGVENIGAGLTEGEIVVEGNAGVYAGRAMSGGTLTIHGHAGDFAGQGKSGGLLVIDGNAGDLVGSALPGKTSGYAGGALVVKGNVGNRFGDRIRKGVVIALGNAGDHCASRAIAGTIWVRGSVGAAPAQGLKRATLLLEQEPSALPTFLDCGLHELGILRILLPSLDRLAGTTVAKTSSGRVHRYLGCVGVDGRGEVLVLGT